VTDIIRIGLDTSKSVFQLHGVDAAEQPVLRRQLRRAEMIKVFEKLPPVIVALEACGASHHWARLLSSFGHEVKLIAPQLAKPYVSVRPVDAALSRPLALMCPRTWSHSALQAFKAFDIRRGVPPPESCRPPSSHCGH
jgi:transposase